MLALFKEIYMALLVVLGKVICLFILSVLVRNLDLGTCYNIRLLANCSEKLKLEKLMFNCSVLFNSNCFLSLPCIQVIS